MPRRSIVGFLERLIKETGESDYLVYRPVGAFGHRGGTYQLARFVFMGPASEDEPVRLGLFAGIHGDEPEGSQALVEFLSRLNREPERARGYQIFAYPICNPSGFEDDTHFSRAGKDLNHEFWQGSYQPEVYYLERELGALGFHGVISLHSGDVGSFYGHSRSWTIRDSLVRPALQAALQILPRDGDGVPSECTAAEATGRKCREGLLVNPYEMTSKPFEIVFETPRRAPAARQVEAAVAALDRVVADYRLFLALQRNI